MDTQESRAFLKKISKNIAQDEPTVSRKDIVRYYHHFIQDLPETDLRATLVKNKEECIAFFVRCVKRAARKLLAKGSQENGQGPQKKTVKAAKKKVAAVPQHEGGEGFPEARQTVSSAPTQSAPPEPVCSVDAVRQQIIQLLKSDKDVDEVEELLGDLWVTEAKLRVTDNTDVDRYCQMLMMTDGVADIHVLKTIMLLRFNTLKDDAEDIIARKMKKRAGKRLKALEKFLKMCHIRKESYQQETETFPTYADLVTGFLSIFLDLFITSHRGEEVLRAVQRSTFNLVKQLTAGLGEKSLDTVLQMTATDSETIPCLSPLIRYLLREKPAKNSHSHYLRYVLTVCMWRNILSGLDDVVTETRIIRAPKGFLPWAVEWQPQLTGEFPDDRKFKGRTITAFLLDDADEDMRTMLSDAIASYERRSAAGSGTEVEGENQQAESDHEEQQTAKKKRKRKKKKKVAAAADTKEEHDKDNEETEDALFEIERRGQMNENSKTAKKRKSEDAVEVFDLSSFGNQESSGEQQEDEASSLFRIDREKTQEASTNGSGAKKRKKKGTGADDVSGQDAFSVQEADGQNGFFVDRGSSKQVSLAGTADEGRVKKKKKTENDSKTSKQSSSSFAQDDEEIGGFFVDRGAKTATSDGTEKAKSKKKKKTADNSKTGKQDISDEVESDDDSGGFFVDRGRKPATTPTSEMKNTTTKKKKTSDSDSSAEDVSISIEMDEESNGFFLDRGEKPSAWLTSEKREEVKTKKTIKPTGSPSKKQDQQKDQVVMDSDGDSTDGDGLSTNAIVQADSTVLSSDAREETLVLEVNGSATTSDSGPMKTRRWTASEMSLKSDQEHSDMNKREGKKSLVTACVQIPSESGRRRTISDSRFFTKEPRQGQRRKSLETISKSDEKEQLLSPAPKRETPAVGKLKKKKKHVSEASPLASPFVSQMATLDICSSPSKSPVKSNSLETATLKSGASPTKSPAKDEVAAALNVSSSPGMPTAKTESTDDATVITDSSSAKTRNTESSPLKTGSSAKSPTKPRGIAAHFLQEEVVPGSDSDESDRNESFVPNSVSETDSQSEIVLVPDLHIHLKQDFSENVSDRRRTPDNASNTTMPSLPEEGSGKTRVSRRQSQELMAEHPSPRNQPSTSVDGEKLIKRKRKLSSSTALSEIEENTVSSSGEVEFRKQSSAKKTGLVPPSPQSKAPSPEENSKTSKKQETPRTDDQPQKKTSKSTTPVSRRTRKQRKSMAANEGTPTSRILAQTTQPEEKATLKASDNLDAKPTSKRAQDGKVKPLKKHLEESGESSEGLSSHSPKNSHVASSKKSRRSKVITSSEDSESSGVATESGSPTKGRRRKSVSLLSDLQRKSVKSMDPDSTTTQSPKSKRKEQTASPAGFTKLKELPESSQASSPNTDSEMARKISGRAEHSPEKGGGKNAGSSSPGEKSSSSLQASEGHEIETRSKSLKKGYNLRRSSKFN